MTNKSALMFVLVIIAAQSLGKITAVPDNDNEDNKERLRDITFTDDQWSEFTDCLCDATFKDCAAHFDVDGDQWTVSVIEPRGNVQGEWKKCRFYICNLSIISQNLTCRQESEQPTSCDTKLGCNFLEIKSFCCGEVCVGTYWINYSMKLDFEQACSKTEYENAGCQTSCSFPGPLQITTIVPQAATNATYDSLTLQTTTLNNATLSPDSVFFINTTNATTAPQFEDVNQTDTTLITETINASPTTNFQLTDYTQQTENKTAINTINTHADNASQNAANADGNQSSQLSTKTVLIIVAAVCFSVLGFVGVVCLIKRRYRLPCGSSNTGTPAGTRSDYNDDLVEMAVLEPLNPPPKAVESGTSEESV